ncbi:hypothetical protein [Halanaeroarchaeum sulfurireducens]|uniref:hypothetical protein n=1 Tax=Halanaeroarchaeum sulfurireducens TaxID=1604004 RepID=UPI0009ACE254|nr:hypothetical protein [Halanaeroarchaeum sulfurireducens]
MTLPAGQPTFDRVVTRLGEPLEAALDRALTGYAEILPQAALLLDASSSGVMWFDDGVPTHATHTGTGATGTDVLAELAATGPFRVRLVSLSADNLHHARPDEATLPPDAPAKRLAGDESLARRTRKRAGTESDGSTDGGLDAVEAFLEDDEKIRAIRDRARAEAKRRAEEWGFDDLNASSEQTGSSESEERDQDEPSRM